MSLDSTIYINPYCTSVHDNGISIGKTFQESGLDKLLDKIVFYVSRFFDCRDFKNDQINSRDYILAYTSDSDGFLSVNLLDKK